MSVQTLPNDELEVYRRDPDALLKHARAIRAQLIVDLLSRCKTKIISAFRR